MIYLNYTQDALYSFYNGRITSLLLSNQKKAAQDEAFNWLQEYVRSLCISTPWNWKIAKKQIAAHYFGKTPSIQLYYDSDISEGMSFILSHSDVNVRVSYHRSDTACHSESRKVCSDDLEWISQIWENMSSKDVIDIFTETSTPTSTCFRRASTQYNEAVVYEIGYGQAMYVFEAERGKHDVAGMDSYNDERKYKNARDPVLTQHLKTLVETHDQMLAMKTRCMCYFLGIPQISIEGYFNTSTPMATPIVVDIDLPFDVAFF